MTLGEFLTKFEDFVAASKSIWRLDDRRIRNTIGECPVEALAGVGPHNTGKAIIKIKPQGTWAPDIFDAADFAAPTALRKELLRITKLDNSGGIMTLGEFLMAFQTKALQYAWYLESGLRIRTTVGHCPIEVVAGTDPGNIHMAEVALGYSNIYTLPSWFGYSIGAADGHPQEMYKAIRQALLEAVGIDYTPTQHTPEA